jgi:hypothetical protein
MHRRAEFSAELIPVCNSLASGGIEQVVSTLANEWARRVREYDLPRALAAWESAISLVGLAR